MTKSLTLKLATGLLLLAGVIVLAMRWPSPDTSACASIPELDRRNHCLALALNQTAPCDAIQLADLRHFCRAQVTEDAAACTLIQNASQRQNCADMLRP